MDEERLKGILESLLFAAGEPVSLARLAAVFDSVPKDEIKNALAGLGNDYLQGGRGLIVEEIAGGYQLRTRKEFAPHIRKLLAAKPPRLSRSLLETLAIVAYRQPITRPEIEELRGVDSGGVLETLLERRLVKIAGRKEAAGRPMLYATTTEFLEVFGLKDLESLPDLKEFQEIERAEHEAESEGVETITELRPHQPLPDDPPIEHDVGSPESRPDIAIKAPEDSPRKSSDERPEQDNDGDEQSKPSE